MRRGWRRSAGRRPERPARQWLPIPSSLVFNAASVTSVQSMLAFEAPTITPGTPITADPPEDQTLLRITASLTVTMTSGNWTLGLMVTDRTWTPIGGEFATDADKRILWSQTYSGDETSTVLAGYVSTSWFPPGNMVVNATTDLVSECPREAVYIDIAPKVKLEDGKQLCFVAWENNGGGTLTLRCSWMRVLMQRSRRGGR